MTNLNDLLAMGGYGFYVWGSYLVTALLVAVEVVAVRARVMSSREAARTMERGQ